jgi:hypothetical protein
MLPNLSKRGLGLFSKLKTPSPECMDVATSQVQSKRGSDMFARPKPPGLGSQSCPK